MRLSQAEDGAGQGAVGGLEQHEIERPVRHFGGSELMEQDRRQGLIRRGRPGGCGRLGAGKAASKE